MGSARTNEIVVIGAGVSGLSCAIRLLEAGFSVRLLARAVAPHITSSVAAAVWYPYMAGPRDKVTAWGAATYRTLHDMARAGVPGVSVIPYVELIQPGGGEDANATPWWATMIPGARPAAAHELPTGYRAGWVIDAPVTDTSVYMPWLMDRASALGAVIEQRDVTSLDELRAPRRIIVNCTGLGARELVGDDAVYPIQGQVVRVERPPGITRGFSDDHHPRGVTYFIPRTHDCILGGTSRKGEWTVEPDESVTRSILDACRRLEPRLADARVLGVRVGLRPGRDAVRLERRPLGDGCHVIHNYGHGGAGFTLSWGCADEVRDLVMACEHLSTT